MAPYRASSVRQSDKYHNTSSIVARMTGSRVGRSCVMADSALIRSVSATVSYAWYYGVLQQVRKEYNQLSETDIQSQQPPKLSAACSCATLQSLALKLAKGPKL